MSKLIGKIFYDKRHKLVFQVRAKISKGFLCGEFTIFVNDARTTIGTMQLSEKYIKRCKKVINYDKCNFLEMHSDIGWRVKR